MAYKLTKEHRQSLINQLNEINDKIDTTERCMAKSEEHMKPTWEIQDFIQKATKKLIEDSLVNNEIDY